MNDKKDWSEFCRNWLSSWTGNKPDNLLVFYAENALYIDPANTDGLRGQEQLSMYFKKLLSRNPDWRWEAVEIFNTVSGFTLKWKATIPVKDEMLILHGLDIVEIKDGQISRNEVYFDRLKWMEMMNR